MVLMCKKCGPFVTIKVSGIILTDLKDKIGIVSGIDISKVFKVTSNF